MSKFDSHNQAIGTINWFLYGIKPVDVLMKEFAAMMKAAKLRSF